MKHLPGSRTPTIWNRYMVFGAIIGSVFSIGIGTLIGGYTGGILGKRLQKFAPEHVAGGTKADLRKVKEILGEFQKIPTEHTENLRQLYQPKSATPSETGAAEPAVRLQRANSEANRMKVSTGGNHADFSQQTRAKSRDTMTRKLGKQREEQTRKG